MLSALTRDNLFLTAVAKAAALCRINPVLITFKKLIIIYLISAVESLPLNCSFSL
jgi:hypothetical protein